MKRTYDEDKAKLRAGETSVAVIVASFLDRIQSINSRLNVFTYVDHNSLQEAEQIDRRLAAGADLPLAGLVISVKDVIAQADKPLTCASNILSGFTSMYTASAIQRLVDSGAIVVGRTNCDEFAMGSTNETSAYGPVFNPVDESSVPGGSSGGAAASVAAGMCHVAVGSDTGGSVRQPAAFCGVVGLKPTYGRISRSGLTAFASSLDCVGVIGNCASDIAIALDVMNGHDPKDATSSVERAFEESDLQKTSLPSIKVGIPAELADYELPSPIRESLEQSRDRLISSGVEFDEVSLPNAELGVAAYYIIATAEASSNLGRYDGVRYGRRQVESSEADDLDQFYIRNRSSGFGAEVKRRLMLGTYVLSAGYYDRYYARAQDARVLIEKDFVDVFKEVDVVMMPVTPSVAFGLNSKRSVLETYLDDVFTVTANLAGIPAIAVPVGTDSDGMPVGVQLLSSKFNESLLLALAEALTE